jgi:hypothetical protein
MQKGFNITYIVSIVEFICKVCMEAKSRSNPARKKWASNPRRLSLTLFREGIPRTYIRERYEPRSTEEFYVLISALYDPDTAT